MNREIKIKGNLGELVIEVQDNGVTIWYGDRWIVDASTIIEDGTIRIGSEYCPLSVKKTGSRPPEYTFSPRKP